MREHWEADAAALGACAFFTGLIAVAAIPLWITIVAAAVTGLLLGGVVHVTREGRRAKRTTAFPRTTYQWQQVSPARRLADEARDHATKAANLGLPTGEWTDLAAFWTAWADTEDQDSTEKATETSVERPTPPKGDAGVGIATLSHGEAVIPIRTVPRTEPPVVLVEAFFPPSGAIKITIDGVGQRVAIAPTGRGSARRDLVVVNDTPHGFQAGIRQDETTAQPGERPVAELRIPPYTAAITQSMIYTVCPEGLIHTRMMKGAPLTEHEVPCDCDVVPASTIDREIERLQHELNEWKRAL